MGVQIDNDNLVNPTLEISGCKHYQRKCNLIAPCCNKRYSCRLCHDEQEDHKLNRFEINKIVCLNCDNTQQVQKYCEFCDTLFGYYFCETCCFFDDSKKQHFHCYDCGFCRVGDKNNFFHCKTCNICQHITTKDKHICIDMSELECPICLEDLRTSTKVYTTLKCNHIIHKECLNDMLKNGNYMCPMCRISIVDMTEVNKILDLEIKEADVEEIKLVKKNKINITCNDCLSKNKVYNNLIGNKCIDCGSYNTQKY